MNHHIASTLSILLSATACLVPLPARAGMVEIAALIQGNSVCAALRAGLPFRASFEWATRQNYALYSEAFGDPVFVDLVARQVQSSCPEESRRAWQAAKDAQQPPVGVLGLQMLNERRDP